MSSVLITDFLSVYKPKFHLIWFFHFKTSKDMAGACGASNPDLFDFIESLEREENYWTTIAAAASTATNNTNIDDTISDSSSTIITNQDSETVDVWQDIARALNNWTQRILDVESRCNNKTATFRQTIEESLRRQQLHGFLNHHDLSELRYIADLWTNLLQAASCYTIGCTFVKRDIITYLLELHSLGQINKSLFIETCLKLWIISYNIEKKLNSFVMILLKEAIYTCTILLIIIDTCLRRSIYDGWI